MNLLLKFAIGFGVGLALSNLGVASDKPEVNVESAIRRELAKRFAHATIEFLPGSTFPVDQPGKSVSQVRILSESGTGTAEYSVVFSDGTNALGQARFSAMIPTYVASRRIRPGEKLLRSDFQLQSVNVAQGLAHQYRGVMLPAKESIDGLQARQTILEGQYPLASGVEKVPDVRRGDAIQVKILSGEIQLSTMATIQEPGYLNQNVRILTQKSKKELVGMLKEGGIVEVKL